ncbi:MAG: hypothetical protein Q4P19_07255 [Methanobrevibacter smithii]|nr:hypothetical protein [Methanobrevibacter smithii]MDO5830861.1 hypothetical protein [Methanobrevibacter smithii]
MAIKMIERGDAEQLIIDDENNFDLIDKIKEVKGITDLGDGEINEVLKEDEIQTTLSD